MAILAPSAIEKSPLPTADSRELVKALRPWRRQFWLQQIFNWTGKGFIAGLFLACVLLIVSRLVPWATALYWSIGVGLACLLGAFALALWYRPSFARTARLVDTRLALHDRLSTAWELRDETSALSELQRRDALAQLGKHTPARSISLLPSRRRLLIFGVVAMAFALLLLLPNPMTAVLQQRAAFQARVAKQIAAIDHIRSLLDSQTPTSDEERKQIDQILHDLQTQLQNAQNETQAQQALSQAQAKLTQLRDPQGTNKAQANAAAATSLQNSSNSNLSSAGQALANGDNKQLANALQNLASQVSKLSPSQRAQLAQQIEQAAGKASQNPELSNALHQLAKAVADGSQSDISDAINAVENAANQDNAEQAQSNRIDQTSQALQQVANSLASATDQSSNPSQSQNSGQQQAQGQGQQPSQGQQQGQGQQSGQGQGQQGQGQGQNQQNGAGGHGGSGGKNGTGNKSGQDEQVFISGQVGSGSSLQTNNGNNGVIQPGSSINYSQVIEQYTQMAHDAIDNSSVSPDLKDLVHGYFDSLEGH